jgi:hypothetical protein
MIANCPVSPTAMLNTNHIFGPDLIGVRGHAVRKPTESVTTNQVRSQGHF